MKLILPIVLILILAFTVLLYYQHTMCWHTFVNIHTIICLVMPVLVFFFLYNICNVLSKSRVLKFVGTYSLQIYLVHVFVINALVMLFNNFTKPSIGQGVIIYVLALGISIGLSIVMVKVPFIKNNVFPNGKIYNK